MFRNIFVSLSFEIFFAWVVEIRRGLDPYKALLCSGTYHSVSFNFVLFVNGI